MAAAIRVLNGLAMAAASGMAEMSAAGDGSNNEKTAQPKSDPAELWKKLGSGLETRWCADGYRWH